MNHTIQQPRQTNSFSLLSNVDPEQPIKALALQQRASPGLSMAIGPSSFKSILLQLAEPNQDKTKSRQKVLSYWQPRGVSVPSLLTRGNIVRNKIKSIHASSSPANPICFKCANRGHTVQECCNVVLCFLCNQLGH